MNAQPVSAPATKLSATAFASSNAAPEPEPNNVIPFTKPRAIAALPATFSPAKPSGPPQPIVPATAQPSGPWGSTPTAQPGAGWGSTPTPAAGAQGSWGSAPIPRSSAPSGSSWGTPASASEPQAASSWGAAAPATAPIVHPNSWGSAAPAIAPARMPHATPAPPIANPTPADTSAARSGNATPSAANAKHGGAPANANSGGPAATTASPPPAPAGAHRAAAAAQNPWIGSDSEATTPEQNAWTAPAPGGATAAPATDTAGTLARSKWAVFESLGLGPPKLDHKKLSGHLVNAYRVLGFAILTIIVIVLVGYLVTTAFFYMSDSWIVPMALSPTDEKVVSLQSQLAERQTARDRTAAELEQAERAIAVQQEFQAEFAKAIKSDLEGRKAALARMYELAEAAASTRAQIKRSNTAYASASQRRMAQEWRAGLIDRESMLNGKYQIAQITNSNLSLAERQAEYETRAADLDAQTRSLEALLTGTTDEGLVSYDILKIKQEYETSRLETQRAIANRDMLKAALEREDKLLAQLSQSSYLKAIADQAHVAFVPYSNLDNVKKGEPLYGCWLTMVFCTQVGTVLEVLPGEVQFKHPNRDKVLRGQMVELKLDDAASATDDVLFVGGRPLLL